jgi:hypothetical protein
MCFPEGQFELLHGRGIRKEEISEIRRPLLGGRDGTQHCRKISRNIITAAQMRPAVCVCCRRFRQLFAPNGLGATQPAVRPWAEAGLISGPGGRLSYLGRP